LPVFAKTFFSLALTLLTLQDMCMCYSFVYGSYFTVEFYLYLNFFPILSAACSVVRRSAVALFVFYIAYVSMLCRI